MLTFNLDKKLIMMTDDQLKYADECINKLLNKSPNYLSYEPKKISRSDFDKVISILKAESLIEKMPSNDLYKFGESVPLIIDKHVTYSAYYQYRLHEEDFRKQKEQLESDNANLTNINLTLQNKQLKTKILFSIIGLIFGFIAANWKDILIILNIITPPETK